MAPEKIKAGFPGLDLLQHFSQLPFFRLAFGGGGFFMHPAFAQDRGPGHRIAAAFYLVFRHLSSPFIISLSRTRPV